MTRGRGPVAEDPWQRTRGRGPLAEDPWQRTRGRGPVAEDPPLLEPARVPRPVLLA